jgi:hypothetical protein
LADSAQNRIIILQLDLHRLVKSGTGRTVAGIGGEIARKANARRHRDGLPELPSVRVITFDPMPPLKSASGKTGGTPKRAHFRRGTWRTLPSGREVWVKPMAIHGGTPDRPPWYEVVE